MPNNENNNLESNLPNMSNQLPTVAFQTELGMPQMNQVNNEQPEQPNIDPQPVQPKEEGGLTKKVIPMIIINAIVIFALFYFTVNKNTLISAGVPIYIILGSIIFAILDKKKSEFPTSVVIGGMVSAVVCFVVSMLYEEQMDLWTYYTAACALTGIIGLMISNIVTSLLTNIKNIKALQTIGYLIVFALIFGVPYLAYKKWPTEFNQYIFYQQNEVVAETYEEYVTKTLKARYNVEFNCDFQNKSYHKTEKNEIMTTLTCKTSVIDTPINIRTIPYNESKVQYTIIDDFLEQVYLKEIKTLISNKVKQSTGATSVITYLYPKDKCIFAGDCADCEDYYDNYSKINDPKNRYEISSSINLSKYMGLSTEDFITKFINENEYKVILNIKGAYDKDYTDFKTLQQKTLTGLNELKLKNTYGYEINFFDTSKTSFETKVNNTIGKTNDTKEFK
ncbi:MAG: MFS transporter [Firmicutes bacterium]|nr:MFS transporter [Bacillota bacterium]